MLMLPYPRLLILPFSCSLLVVSAFLNHTYVIPQSTMLQGIERYLKQAIVDKNASVSSASLVSALVS